MSIKFADEIIKEIEKRGSVKIPNGNVTGEEFEKWLMVDCYLSVKEQTVEKYIVKKVAFDANEEFLNKEKEVDLDFDFDTKSNVDGNTMEIELSVNIFDDAVKNGYPFEMKVILKGFFSIDNEGEVKDISIFETNAIAILFPYLRAIVSSYTANANVAPVLLPAMNINEYIRRKYQNGEKQA